MSYVDKTLAAGEEIVHRANFNWTYSFFPVFWFAIGFSPLVMLTLVALAVPNPADNFVVAWWSGGIAAALGAIILTNHMIYLWTTEIVVTSFRFVYKTGLVSRSTQEVSLNKIEEITLRQTVSGRLFGYGQLILRGTGVGVIELPNLDNPIEVRRIIETAKANLRRDSSQERLQLTD